MAPAGADFRDESGMGREAPSRFVLSAGIGLAANPQLRARGSVARSDARREPAMTLDSSGSNAAADDVVANPSYDVLLGRRARGNVASILWSGLTDLAWERSPFERVSDSLTRPFVFPSGRRGRV